VTTASQQDAAVLEHVGVKGMKWGVRKAAKGRDAAVKKIKERRADSRQFKMASKLTSGELVVSALVLGPVGVLGYKAVKRSAAKTKMKNKDLSPDQQTEAARKINIGAAAASTLIAGPVGLVGYAAAKAAAANNVEDF
jgi:precorrin isomerase